MGELGEGAKILVIDDEPYVRASLERVLRASGYDVVLAANAHDALERLRDASLPALVLVDLVMPEMSGAAFLGALRADPRLADLPVVLMTGGGRSVPPGVPLLVKPPSVPELLDTVARHAR